MEAEELRTRIDAAGTTLVPLEADDPIRGRLGIESLTIARGTFADWREIEKKAQSDGVMQLTDEAWERIAGSHRAEKTAQELHDQRSAAKRFTAEHPEEAYDRALAVALLVRAIDGVDVTAGWSDALDAVLTAAFADHVFRAAGKAPDAAEAGNA